MPEVTKYAPGTFAWSELTTSDQDGAKKFYGSLLGWQFEDNPMSETMVYTMFTKGGKYVAATYQMDAEESQQGVPPHWRCYVSVDSVDAATKQAETLGGTVVMPGMDVYDAGRMAMVQDPTGAMVALWQPNQHIGATLANEPGAFCWNELMTKAPEQAAEFYTGLFGWSCEKQEGLEIPYYQFSNGDQPAGGMLQLTEEMAGMPPHWNVYFAVENLESATKVVAGSGGEHHMGPMTVEGVGTFSMMSDPQGAHFYAIQLES